MSPVSNAGLKEQTMAAPPIPSALDARTQIFPTLTPLQIDRIRPQGHVRHVDRGEILFDVGDTNIPFFVILSGSMEVVQPGLDGERPITVHRAGGFTGELTMISGRRIFVRGRVIEPGDFIELTGDALRSVIAKDAELSEIFMRAFILRRLDRINVKVDEIPVVICGQGYVLRNPTIQKLADCLGFNADVDAAQLRDLIIVGAGPSGLAAAVYAASEGLDVLLIETESPGGQAASSSKIENYLGFPYGLSGQELANRAITQAEKFGAKMMIARNVVRLECARRPYKVVLDNGVELAARSVVIATGAQYNKPRIANLTIFEGQGVYYGATFMEAQLCGDDDIIVVGGGNSAGQAAVYMSQTQRKVHILVRSGQLSDTMSRYLIQRVEQNPNIEIHYRTEIISLEGDSHLEHVRWRNNQI